MHCDFNCTDTVGGFPAPTSKNIRMEPSVNSGDREPSSSAASAEEVRRLLEEHARLRSFLVAHRLVFRPGGLDLQAPGDFMFMVSTCRH
jgi:hypothetical protein